MRSMIVALHVAVPVLFAMGSFGAPDEVLPTAVVGVTNAHLSQDASLKADGPLVDLGTVLGAVQATGEAVRIRSSKDGERWIHRIYLCTPNELQARRKAGQIPDAKRITFIGVADDGQDTMYGHIHVEGGRVGLTLGQILCFNQKYCKAHKGDKATTWMGLRGPRRTDSLYLIASATSATELPTWPRERQEEPPPAWLKFPASGLLAFSLGGSFESPPSFHSLSVLSTEWENARRLVSDEAFLVKHPRGPFNVWAGLTKIEKNFRADEIPHTIAHRDLRIPPADLARRYGQPSHVGSFKCEDGQELRAYWFGPVCVTAKDRTSPPVEIGGWPSRLLYKEPPIAKKGLPPYLWRVPSGNSSIEVTNPNKFPVLIGFRSADHGLDCRVKGAQRSTYMLTPGRYEVFFIFGNTRDALFQGDSVELAQEGQDRGAITAKAKLLIPTVTDADHSGLRKVR